MSRAQPRRARPLGMDHVTWRAFCLAWSAAATQKGQTTALRRQLCAEYGISFGNAYKWAGLGAGMRI